MIVRISSDPLFNRSLVLFFGLALILLQSVRGLPISINFTLSFALITFFLLAVLYRPVVNRISVIVFFVLSAWLVFPILQTPLVTYDISLHFRGILIPLFYTIAAIVFGQLLFSSRTTLVRTAFYVMGISVLVTFVLFLLYLATGFNLGQGEEFSGLFGNRNYMAFALAMSLIIPLCYIRDYSWLMRLVVFFCVLSTLVITVASASVAGTLGFLLLLGAVSFFAFPSRYKMLTFVLIVVAVASIVVVENKFKDRLLEFTYLLTSPEDVRDFGSQARRSWMIVSGVQHVLENPFGAVGLDNERFHFIDPGIQRQIARGQAEEGIGTHLHNNYLGLALGGGVQTLLFYYIPLFYIFLRSALLASRSEAYAVIATILLYRFWVDVANTTYRDIPTIVMTTLAVYLYVNGHFKRKRAHVAQKN